MTARNMRHRGRSWTAPRRARRHTIVARLEFPAILSNAEDKLMENFVWIGRVSGLVGVLLFIVAGIVRLTGRFFLGGFQLGTPDDLPTPRRDLYDRSGRKSQVLIKAL